MKTIVPVNRLPAISRTALRTAVSVVLALTALAGCDKASGLEFDDDTPQGTVTIAALKSRCTGAQAAVTEDITVEGVVTGNDLYGEFYKTLVVEDTSGGISIAPARHIRPWGACRALPCRRSRTGTARCNGS